MKDTIITFIRKIFDFSTPYDALLLYPGKLKVHIINKHYEANEFFPKYSCVIPVLNEEKTVIATLQSLEIQRPLPDEVIIVDGGSSDSTLQKIKEYKQHSKLWIKVLVSPIKRNIGYQRNIAIDHAKNDLLMNVDCGTILDANYATNMLGPFLEHKDLDLVCGVHYPKTEYLWSSLFTKKEHFVKRVEPYGACIMYRKKIAIKAGKYPEYLTYAGEDTFFIYKYKKLSRNWVFNKAASLLWEHPPTFKAMIKKKINYGAANFEIGLWPYFYYKKLFHPLLKWIVRFSPIYLFYRRFLKAQAIVEIERRKIHGLCVIFSEAPIFQNEKMREYAVKAIEDNYKVFFISRNNLDSHLKYFINTDHSLLELISYKDFSLELMRFRYGDFMNKALFILDHKDVFANKIYDLKKKYKNVMIVYTEDLQG
jgi:glycosyltransferase involved in cell wall biosynthesis